MTKSYNVLFICMENSARSIMAEVILNRLGAGRFKAYSAGSHPVGAVHPLTKQVLTSLGYETTGLYSKGVGEFAGANAPSMNFIFTVCDRAAGEVCPAWPGQPITAHWGFPDPAAVGGTSDEQLKAFTNTAHQIANRIRLFTNLPLDKLAPLSLQATLAEMGSGKR